jgi:hypothetical protein
MAKRKKRAVSDEREDSCAIRLAHLFFNSPLKKKKKKNRERDREARGGDVTLMLGCKLCNP